MSTELTNAAIAAASAAVEDTPVDSLTRALTRTRIIIGGMYDDDTDDPDQAIRDLLTDVIHECAGRGVDVDAALARAKWMAAEEREDWGGFQ